MSFVDIADCLKAGISASAAKEDVTRFLNACIVSAANMKVEYWIDSGLNDLQASMLIRSIIIARIADINETLGAALSRGYLLPDSPFPAIDSINATRQLFGSVNLDFNSQIFLFNAAVDLSEIAKSYKEGSIKFDRNPSVQLLSYEVSVDGISAQSGDPLADILGYQPDGDFVKRKRAIDSLSKLDFSKRKPYLLFTLGTDSGGIVICWSKMRDASGYVISRRDVFNVQELPDIVKSNEGLQETTKELLNDDRFFQALSFYDWTTPDDVVAIRDESISQNTLYSFTINGIQTKAPASPFIFDVPMNSLLFSQVMADDVMATLAEEATRLNRTASIASPYPAVSNAVYGDPSYGWIIAGCNVLASIRRGDNIDVVRANSFVGSTVEHIISEAKAGRLFVPSDLSQVQAAVEDAISSYGVSQTILSILDATGTTNFISGKDDPNGIQATQASIEGSTSGLAKILSVIDPETATLDPNLLVIGLQPRVSRTTTIFVKQSSSRVLDDIIAIGVIDLTTHSGISRFMQLLRTVYDFYPGAFV